MVFSKTNHISPINKRRRRPISSPTTSNNTASSSHENASQSKQAIMVMWFVTVGILTAASLFVSFLYVIPNQQEQQRELGNAGDHQHHASSSSSSALNRRRRKRRLQDENNNNEKIQPNYNKVNHIAWLLSFPNSGTTYTLANAEHVTNYTTATNYEDEIVLLSSQQQIWPLNSLKGTNEDAPFLKSPHLSIAPQYTLTKTHCVGYSYCDDCHYTQVVQDLRAFEKGCRRADINTRLPALEDSENCRENNQWFYYSSKHILKVVHLIRNPFDNVVARMHLGVELRRREPERMKTELFAGVSDDADTTTLLSQFNDTLEGVLSWCHYIDTLFHDPRSLYKADGTTFRGKPSEAHAVRNVTIDDATLDAMRGVPCHSEWFRYVQWHNFAVQMYTTQLRLIDAPKVIYFEDYTSNLQSTSNKIIEYLEQQNQDGGHSQQQQSTPLPFKANKVYRHLFSEEYMQQVAFLIKRLATPECWKLLKRYFTGYDWFVDDNDNNGENNDEIEEDDLSQTHRRRLQAAVPPPAPAPPAAVTPPPPPPITKTDPEDERESKLLSIQNSTSPQQNHPKLVWLMSFPKSGSRFTLYNIQRMAGVDVATHRFQDVGMAKNKEELNLLYPGMADRSPLLMRRYDDEYNIPNLVLTRNDCTGFCPLCPPTELYRNFDKMCSSVTHNVGGKVSVTKYDRDTLVDSSIMLIRNPYNVILSRMMNGVVDMSKKLNITTRTKAKQLRNKEPRQAMLQWCSMIDTAFEMKDEGPPIPPLRSQPLGYNVLYRSLIKARKWRKRRYHCPNLLWGTPYRYQQFRRAGNYTRITKDNATEYVMDRQRLATLYSSQKLPCYSEWLRYIQWHNYALQVRADLPGFVVYFERYLRDYKGTLLQIVHYLNLTSTKNPYPFDKDRATGGGYDNNNRKLLDLYTPTEKQLVLDLVDEHASDMTYELIRHYFD